MADWMHTLDQMASEVADDLFEVESLHDVQQYVDAMPAEAVAAWKQRALSLETGDVPLGRHLVAFIDRDPMTPATADYSLPKTAAAVLKSAKRCWQADLAPIDQLLEARRCIVRVAWVIEVMASRGLVGRRFHDMQQLFGNRTD